MFLRRPGLLGMFVILATLESNGRVKFMTCLSYRMISRSATGILVRLPQIQEWREGWSLHNWQGLGLHVQREPKAQHSKLHRKKKEDLLKRCKCTAYKEWFAHANHLLRLLGVRSHCSHSKGYRLLNLEHFGNVFKAAFNGDLQKPTEQRDPWISKSTDSVWSFTLK